MVTKNNFVLVVGYEYPKCTFSINKYIKPNNHNKKINLALTSN